MKRHNNKTNFRLGAIIIIVSILVAIITFGFLMDTLTFSSFTIRIFLIEWDAAEGYWTANGFVNWSDSLIEAYNTVLHEREMFVATNDVGNFLYHCGYSITGQIVRLVAILAAIAGLAFSLELAFVTTKSFIKALVATNKKAVRRASYRCH